MRGFSGKVMKFTGMVAISIVPKPKFRKKFYKIVLIDPARAVTHIGMGGAIQFYENASRVIFAFKKKSVADAVDPINDQRLAKGRLVLIPKVPAHIITPG